MSGDCARFIQANTARDGVLQSCYPEGVKCSYSDVIVFHGSGTEFDQYKASDECLSCYAVSSFTSGMTVEDCYPEGGCTVAEIQRAQLDSSEILVAVATKRKPSGYSDECFTCAVKYRKGRTVEEIAAKCEGTGAAATLSFRWEVLAVIICILQAVACGE